MKLAIANVAVDILAGIKLNKISDKKMKMSLVKDYIKLKEIVQKPRETKLELENKFREDWQEEIPEVTKLRTENKSLDAHKKYIEAENDLIKMINDLFSQEVKVEIKSIKLEDFVSTIGEEVFTLDAIAILKESGVLV